MRRNPYSTGYVAQKIRANTARWNAGLDSIPINPNAKIDVDEAIRSARFLLDYDLPWEEDCIYIPEFRDHTALADAIMCQMMGVRPSLGQANIIMRELSRVQGNDSHPFNLAYEKASKMADAIIKSGKKIRSNTARRNAGLDSIPINPNAKIDVDKAIRDAKFLLAEDELLEESGAYFFEFGHITALTDAIMFQMMGVRPSLPVASGISEELYRLEGNDSHPFNLACERASEMADAIIKSGKWR